MDHNATVTLSESFEWQRNFFTSEIQDRDPAFSPPFFLSYDYVSINIMIQLTIKYNQLTTSNYYNT